VTRVRPCVGRVEIDKGGLATHGKIIIDCFTGRGVQVHWQFLSNTFLPSCHGDKRYLVKVSPCFVGLFPNKKQILLGIHMGYTFQGGFFFIHSKKDFFVYIPRRIFFIHSKKDSFLYISLARRIFCLSIVDIYTVANSGKKSFLECT